MNSTASRLPNIFELLYSSDQWINRDWLILGKGPSFSLFRNDYSNVFHILTLNDSIREVKEATIAHFIDFDAFKRSSESLQHAQFVVLPWFPHFNHKAGTQSLAELWLSDPALAQLATERRLYWYDLNTSAVRHGSYPVLSASFFSAEAALDLLATAGVRRVRSLGLDGGNSYSAEFSDLSNVSLLSNGRKNFDRQFSSFAQVIARTGVDYAPLDMDAPVRIHVASTASEALPVKVLEYSIKQHASASVTVTPLCDVGISIPKPQAPKNQPRTPFSFQRFLIPQVCGHEGRSIYLDSDMLVFKDVVDLWRSPFGEANVLAAYSDSASGRKPQFSVMLMDCSQLKWNIQDIVDRLNSGALSYEQLMYDFSLARTSAVIEPEWNSLEIFKPGQTALLHYTDMNTQPWVSHLNPLGYLWVHALRQAIQDGAISRSFVEEEVQKGHVRPSLLYQLDQGVDDAILLPSAALALDTAFTPPYRSLVSHRASPWKNHLLWLRASIRSKYQKTALYKLERRIIRRLKEQLGH